MLIAIVAIAFAVGALLPVEHRAMREAVYRVPRDTLFAALMDVERFPEWRSGLKRIQRAAAAEGKPRYVEVSGDGEILYEVAEAVAGRRLVTRIADPKLPFGGTWTYELEDAPAGTLLRITEDGEVYNPLFRFVSRFIISPHRSIDRFLDDLGRRVGSPPVLGQGGVPS